MFIWRNIQTGMGLLVTSLQTLLRLTQSWQGGNIKGRNPYTFNGAFTHQNFQSCSGVAL